MKVIILSIVMLLSALSLQAQSISYIKTTNAWYYIYDQDGKLLRTISAQQGELQGYSASFYIIRQGTAFYIIYDASGKRLNTMAVTTVGEIQACCGDTFTSRNGSWIYTWTKEGKRISTRAAK